MSHPAMRTFAAFVVSACSSLFLFVPLFVLASTRINEVLFDPSGTDTGLEKIELYNATEAAIDMAGWELYPDGIGYFTFPAGFSIAPQAFVVIHLRASGADDSANRYHAAASGNMGNSSGSVALFRPGGRSSETIVDFVRYHMPGSSERKTWESAAAEAGLWTAGTFIDVSGFSEGSSIGLASDGVRSGAGSWQTFATSSFGAANGSAPALPSPSPAVVSPPPAAPTLQLSLRASAGSDVTVMAGAATAFEGSAFGLDGTPLAGARFVWNFGDGTLHEGRATTHVYRFPGRYHANLTVQSGEVSGSDWRLVTVLPARLVVSEVMPGRGGFIELASEAEVGLDLGGVAVVAGATFRIPLGTIIEPQGVLTFANAVTGLNAASAVALHDAQGNQLDAVLLLGALAPGGSWERVGERMVPTAAPTPGSLRQSAPRVPPSPQLLPSTAPSATPAKGGSVAAVPTPLPPPPPESQTVASDAAVVAAPWIARLASPPAFAGFAGAVALGGAIAFFLMKRRLGP